MGDPVTPGSGRTGDEVAARPPAKLRDDAQALVREGLIEGDRDVGAVAAMIGNPASRRGLLRGGMRRSIYPHNPKNRHAGRPKTRRAGGGCRGEARSGRPLEMGMVRLRSGASHVPLKRIPLAVPNRTGPTTDRGTMGGPVISYQPSPDRYLRMFYRRCGRSGIQLPAVTLGLWQNFGADTPHATARQIVLRAFDLGITHIDLANNYGPPPGFAEESFGRIRFSARISAATATSSSCRRRPATTCGHHSRYGDGEAVGEGVQRDGALDVAIADGDGAVHRRRSHRR
jgi:hypothetical protein